jgi:5'-3' exonuclease
MGIPHFLQELLPSTGKPLDLTTLVDSNPLVEHSQGPNDDGGERDDESSPSDRLRVGVDVSSWIYRACMGFSDMLGDERHLTNLGRADLLKKQADEEAENRSASNADDDDDDDPSAVTGPSETEELDVAAQKYVAVCTEQVKKKLVNLKSYVDVLVVLDGATPPIKRPTSSGRAESRQAFLQQRDDANVDPTGQDTDARIRAFKRAGAGRYYSVVVANLIQECRHSRIPFLVAPYEADGQLGYLSERGLIDLVVSEDSDLMACACTHVLYKMNDTSLAGTLLRRNDMFASRLLRDFSDAMLAVVFVAGGGDYCDKLKGIGFKTAVRIVGQSFFDEPARSKSAHPPPLQRVFHKLFSETWDSATLTAEFKADFERRFLSALLMYRHPVVFDPISATTVVARASGGLVGLDAELASYPPYVEMFRAKLRSIVGDLVPRPLCIHVAEGWISPRTHRSYPIPDASQMLPASVRSYLEKRAATEVAASSTTVA